MKLKDVVDFLGDNYSNQESYILLLLLTMAALNVGIAILQSFENSIIQNTGLFFIAVLYNYLVSLRNAYNKTKSVGSIGIIIAWLFHNPLILSITGYVVIIVAFATVVKTAGVFR